MIPNHLTSHERAVIRAAIRYWLDQGSTHSMMAEIRLINAVEKLERARKQARAAQRRKRK